MIQKQGNWIPYELKPRDVERWFFTCEHLIQRQQRKGFLHRIVTGDEKWIFYPKKKKYYVKLGQSLPSTSTSTPWPNIHGSKIMLCIWWTKRVLFTIYWAAETWRFHYGWSVLGTMIRFVHYEKNGRNTNKDIIKLFFFMTTFSLMSLKS